jgi:hypothetical protein
MIEVMCIILHMHSTSNTDPNKPYAHKGFFLILIYFLILLIINDRIVGVILDEEVLKN